MSWYAGLRHAAGLPIVLLSLSLGVVVSCVSVASSAALPQAAADDEPAVAMVAASLAPTPTVTVGPTLPEPTLPDVSARWGDTATLVPMPTVTPLPTPARAPSPEPVSALAQAATPVSTPIPTEIPTPVQTLAPTQIPADTPSPSPTPAEPSSSAADVASAGRGFARSKRRKLNAILANQAKNKGIAGLQAAVRMPGGETWLGTAGQAEYSPGRTIRNDTQFAIASVSKTFVSALILQLVDEGVIDLDAPFGTYFSDAPRSKNVTVRQLLSHTSGIYNFFEHPRYGQAAGAWLRSAPTGQNAREHRWTYDEIMGLVKTGYCKPGACYHYSNTNYVILGKVAEAVGGAPIHEQLRERFFEPLGMRDTVYQPAERPRADAAHGHWPRSGGYIDHTRDARVVPFMAAASVADAAGAIASTARDLSVWAAALYGGELHSAKALSQMTTFLQPGTYGLGTDVAVFAGHRGHGHRGGLRGFESSMWYFPKTGVSVVLLSNQGNWLTDAPMQKLVKSALGGS